MCYSYVYNVFWQIKEQKILHGDFFLPSFSFGIEATSSFSTWLLKMISMHRGAFNAAQRSRFSIRTPFLVGRRRQQQQQQNWIHKISFLLNRFSYYCGIMKSFFLLHIQNSTTTPSISHYYSNFLLCCCYCHFKIGDAIRLEKKLRFFFNGSSLIQKLAKPEKVILEGVTCE